MSSVQGTIRPPHHDGILSSEASGADAGDDDARACQRIVARHARTFSVASRLLPAEKRRGVFAIYAACRIADDIVDVTQDGSAPALARFREEVFHGLIQRSDDPILRELARAWHRFDLPDELLHELFDGLAADLSPRVYESWPDLESYCQGVAGSVGAMCTSVFGVVADMGHRRSVAVTCGRTLGVAMQLTNILRDVGEDARRGRCYLPMEDLSRFGLDRERVLSGSALGAAGDWRALMRFQISRARELYRRAMPGIALLELDAQRCAVACATGYSKILDAIERADFDTVTHRVAASRMTLLRVAWRSWVGDLPVDVTTGQAGA